MAPGGKRRRGTPQSPTITGTAQQGQTLTTTNGSWSGSPTSYGYQWQHCSSGCSNITGATGSTYMLQASDVGYTIDVVVTATNAGGSASGHLRKDEAVKLAAPTNTTAPTVSGTAQQGQTLTTSNGSWTGARPRTPISGRTAIPRGAIAPASVARRSSSYTLVSGDVGHTIACGRHRHERRRLGRGFLGSDGRRRRTAACAAVEYRASADQRHRGGRADADDIQRYVDEQPDLVSIRSGRTATARAQLHGHQRRELQQLHGDRQRRGPHDPVGRHRRQRRRNERVLLAGHRNRPAAPGAPSNSTAARDQRAARSRVRR